MLVLIKISIPACYIVQPRVFDDSLDIIVKVYQHTPVEL